MATSPFRRCDYCGGTDQPFSERYARRAWTLFHSTRKLACPACERTGRAEDDTARVVIERHRELLHYRLVAEPQAKYNGDDALRDLSADDADDTDECTSPTNADGADRPSAVAEPADLYGFPQHQQFDRIKAQYPDAILLFRDGDFYMSIGEDALKLDLILGVRPLDVLVGEKTLPLGRFPFHALDMYLPALVRAGYRVAICDQLEGDLSADAEPAMGWPRQLMDPNGQTNGPCRDQLVSEPFGDPPLPKTHRLMLKGHASEVDVHLSDGRYFGLDGTWDIATTDRAIRRVVLRYGREDCRPALYGDEHGSQLAADPPGRCGRAAKQVRHLRNERRLVLERLEDLAGVLERHEALPQFRGLDHAQHITEFNRSQVALARNADAIALELRLRKAELVDVVRIHCHIGPTHCKFLVENLPELIRDAKRVFREA